jgi:glycosyltransferase involved in cell wall biosynthesis
MRRVTILLGTLNGARFLPNQLASIKGQDFPDWTLVASDDGSTDETLSILRSAQEELGNEKLLIVDGPRRGFVQNFLSLACNHGGANFFAFSDQDDVWHPEKLSRALKWHATIPPEVPALYCARTRLIDDAENVVGYSPLFRRQPSFQNAMVQSIAGGNTMVFNDAARRLVTFLGADVPVPSHDWWLYLLVTGAGGQVRYDPVPSVDYRVHSHNIVGSNIGWPARVTRLRELMGGRLKRWTDAHEVALTKFRPRMTPANRELFDLFQEARHSGFHNRLRMMNRSGVYRQTRFGNIGLVAATLLKKI